ncbi:10843_t:CDS:2 [Dentiscutata erythropus]|uniref:10843_t:CDS:1 n=1 Tax=Dentiscutata erythropus TaxID=1348616 RepID=A0A9N9K1C0_9GLOM|nr:10843_t:CDS:2 [Dentiscutata erythropus]
MAFQPIVEQIETITLEEVTNSNEEKAVENVYRIADELLATKIKKREM